MNWRYSRRQAVLVLCHGLPAKCIDYAWSLAGSGLDPLLLTQAELPLGLYDRWSKVFLYSVEGEFLEPNLEVTVEIHPPWSVNDDVVAQVSVVQRSSWGFYIPPPSMDYVLLAVLPDGSIVGSAYYNPASSNIDYGVHVSKSYWRHRIGSRLLVETARLASSLGCKWFSVVRVIRGVKLTASDRRAIAFYRANKPMLEFNVYRLKRGDGI